MRRGVSLPNVGSAAGLVELGRAADANGWDGVFLWDHLHFVRAWSVETHDPWVLLGAMATRTERVRLGTLITPLARRRPHKVAKEVVTLDHLSGGRAVLGVGLGEPPDDDFAAFGDPSGDRERARLLDQGLELLDPYLRGEPVAAHGVDAHLLPAAVQRPRPPIWVAGKWPNRRPFERAQRHQGYVPIGPDDEHIFLPPATLAEIAARLPAGVELVATAEPGVPAHEYADAGATWLLDSTWPVEEWEVEMRERVVAGPT